MDQIRVIHSDAKTSDSLIYELMKIEHDVYSPEYQGEYSSIVRRFHAYKDMFVLAYSGDEVIGYLCYFPISDRLYNEIISNNEFHDDDIMLEDICITGKQSHFYLLSIALLRKFHGNGIGKMMMMSFLEKLKHSKEDGNKVIDVIASVVTSRGEKICADFGFAQIKDLSETAHYKLFCLEGINMKNTDILL